VRAVVDELLAAKERDGLSVRYVETLRSHLNRFADAFATNVGSVTAKLIEDWLARQNVGARARNNIRTSIVTLFHFAQSRDYLPKGQPTEVDYVPKAKDRGGRDRDLHAKTNGAVDKKGAGGIRVVILRSGFCWFT
jgi:hypothetical protein